MSNNNNRSISGSTDGYPIDLPSEDIGYSYDVFLSFRGEDTRKGFTGHLFGALDQMGVNTFVDSEELHKGEEISDTLIKSIERSRIAIIVFSENYATSHWCLDEVTKIMGCKKSKGQKVLPVFYHVDPSHVRNQKGSYARAFKDHEKKWKDKIKGWRIALKEAGTLSGYPLDGQEYSVIQQIVKEVLFLLNHKPLHVPANLVGMHTHLEAMNSLLDLEKNDCRMIGICETGGSGKTTIAKFIYNEIADQFSHRGFLANVRETCQASPQSGLLQLQQKLFSQIMRDNYSKIEDVDKGVSMIKARSGDKKTLLVIDDVDHLEQLQKLAGSPEWYGAGSRIIITSRNSEILENHDVIVYKVPPLEPEDVKDLFTRILCQDNKDKEDYEQLLTQLVGRRKRFPLAVRVLASSLRGKSKQEWQSTLEKLKKITDREIFDALYVSYQNLGDHEQQVFLDIACFFKGQPLEYVRNALHSLGYYPDSDIGELISRSLIFINRDKIDMHREIQEMGWEIVRRESPKDLTKRSRLWITNKDDLQVLSEHTERMEIEGIKLEFKAPEVITLSSKAFAQMRGLRLFIAHNVHYSGTPLEFPRRLSWLEWPEYSLRSLPLNHENGEITGLYLSRSNIRLLKDELQPFSKLKSINFSYSTSLRKIPDLSSLSNLQSLDVKECINLAEVHQSLGSLENVVHLNFLNCRELHTFAFCLKSKSLTD